MMTKDLGGALALTEGVESSENSETQAPPVRRVKNDAVAGYAGWIRDVRAAWEALDHAVIEAEQYARAVCPHYFGLLQVRDNRDRGDPKARITLARNDKALGHPLATEDTVLSEPGSAFIHLRAPSGHNGPHRGTLRGRAAFLMLLKASIDAVYDRDDRAAMDRIRRGG